MKNITRAELIPLVIAEATKLKAKSFKYERAKLNFDKLNAGLPTRCIYGQMTGSCWSERAIELIEESCERVLHCNPQGQITGALNGSPKGIKRTYYWSPIESFIYRNEENVKNLKQNKALIDFIKGETETLELK